jgi:hypothetical protein
MGVELIRGGNSHGPLSLLYGGEKVTEVRGAGPARFVWYWEQEVSLRPRRRGRKEWKHGRSISGAGGSDSTVLRVSILIRPEGRMLLLSCWKARFFLAFDSGYGEPQEVARLPIVSHQIHLGIPRRSNYLMSRDVSVGGGSRRRALKRRAEHRNRCWRTPIAFHIFAPRFVEPVDSQATLFSVDALYPGEYHLVRQ